MNLAGVRAVACHQLTPELAEQISRARAVVFVDAVVSDKTEIQFTKLVPVESGRILGHVSEPGTLLALARDLFHRCPPAWWLTIPVREVGFGEELSPQAREGMRCALERIQTLAAGPLNERLETTDDTDDTDGENANDANSR
jgi:Ni,Fe-hydrogenase maturation factor